MNLTVNWKQKNNDHKRNSIDSFVPSFKLSDSICEKIITKVNEHNKVL